MLFALSPHDWPMLVHQNYLKNIYKNCYRYAESPEYEWSLITLAISWLGSMSKYLLSIYPWKKSQHLDDGFAKISLETFVFPRGCTLVQRYVLWSHTWKLFPTASLCLCEVFCFNTTNDSMLTCRSENLKPICKHVPAKQQHFVLLA